MLEVEDVLGGGGGCLEHGGSAGTPSAKWWTMIGGIAEHGQDV